MSLHSTEGDLLDTGAIHTTKFPVRRRCSAQLHSSRSGIVAHRCNHDFNLGNSRIDTVFLRCTPALALLRHILGLSITRRLDFLNRMLLAGARWIRHFVSRAVLILDLWLLRSRLLRLRNRSFFFGGVDALTGAQCLENGLLVSLRDSLQAVEGFCAVLFVARLQGFNVVLRDAIPSQISRGHNMKRRSWGRTGRGCQKKSDRSQMGVGRNDSRARWKTYQCL